MAKSASDATRPGKSLPVLQSPELQAAAKACPLLEGEADWAECCTRRFLPVARRITGDNDVAFDALQESWIRILQAVWQYRGGSPACAWVRTIVENCAKDTHKGPQKSEVPLEKAVLEMRDPHPDPEFVLLEEQFRRLLREMVAALPEIYREVLEERLIEGRSTSETATELGITYTNVTSRLQRACTMLAESLGIPRKVIVDALKK